MMWRKAELFGDHEIAQLILAETNPGKVKALGRRVRNFDVALWNANAKAAVRDGVLLKFQQNADIKDVLLATGDKVLVEASPHDAIWGIGLAEADAKRTPEAQWPGTNWLGEVLMDVRAILRRNLAASQSGSEDEDATEKLSST